MSKIKKIISALFYNNDHDDHDVETWTTQRLSWRMSPVLVSARKAMNERMG